MVRPTADNVSSHAERCQPAQPDGVHDLIWHVALASAVATSTNATVVKGQCNKTRRCSAVIPEGPAAAPRREVLKFLHNPRRQIELHLGSMVDQLWRQSLSGFSWPSVRAGQRSHCRQCAGCQFRHHQSLASRTQLGKIQFHQKPLSSKTEFIKKQFHQKQFHQNPISSMWTLSSKNTFIKNHFHHKSN